MDSAQGFSAQGAEVIANRPLSPSYNVLALAAPSIAADADKAIVAVLQQSAETLKAAAPAGQGQNVDRTV